MNSFLESIINRDPAAKSKLSVILIGDYLPSQIYVKNKQKKAKEVGIKSEVIKYPETVSEKEILEKESSLFKNTFISLVYLFIWLWYFNG